jgi:Ca2+-binding EF-hand superfamily protein
MIERRFQVDDEKRETLFQALDSEKKGYLDKKEVMCLVTFIENSLCKESLGEESAVL